MPLAESIAGGLAVNILYDLLRGNTPKNIINKISTIYDESVKELSTEYDKDLSVPIKQIFKDSYVKYQIKEFKGGREKIIEHITQRAKDLVSTKHKTLSLDRIVPRFYSIFMGKLRRDDTLYKRLQEIYTSVILDHTLAIKERLEELNKNFYDLKQEIIKNVGEKSYLKVVKSSGFPKLYGGFQMRIIGQSLSELFQNLDNYAFEGKDGFMAIKKINGNEFTTIYIPKKSNNSIRINYKGNPYQIVYPPINSVDVWIKQKENFIEVTCFSGSFGLDKELYALFRNCAHSKVLFKRITFDRNMKKLLQKHLGQITTIEYDPLIWGKIEIEGVVQDRVADRATISGEKGIMKHDKIQKLIKSLKKIRPGQVADIYFFKAEESAKFDGKYNTTFDVNHDGRLIAYFNKKKYSDEDMRKSIYNFIIAHGLEE